MFYDFESDAVNKNWIIAGVHFPASPRLKLEFNYMFQNKSGTDEWSNSHILRTALKYSL